MGVTLTLSHTLSHTDPRTQRDTGKAGERIIKIILIKHPVAKPCGGFLVRRGRSICRLGPGPSTTSGEILNTHTHTDTHTRQDWPSERRNSPPPPICFLPPPALMSTSTATEPIRSTFGVLAVSYCASCSTFYPAPPLLGPTDSAWHHLLLSGSSNPHPFPASLSCGQTWRVAKSHFGGSQVTATFGWCYFPFHTLECCPKRTRRAPSATS